MPVELPLWVLAAVGFLIGAIGTLAGLGGGFLLVPFLLQAVGLPERLAVGTSSFSIFFNAASGSVAYVRRRRADLRMAAWFAAATIPGAILGVKLSEYHKPDQFRLVFGLLMIVSAGWLAWRPDAGAGSGGAGENAEVGQGYRLDLMRGLPVSFFAGILASLFGLGAGIVHVPFLMLVLGIPAHIATATSHCILVVTTLVSAGGFMMEHQVDYGSGLPIAIGMIAGAQCGALLSDRLSGRTIRWVLAAFVAGVGIEMIYKGVSGP